MSKKRNSRNRIHIPGAQPIKVPVIRKDPTIAPTGTAFTIEQAQKYAEAALKGVAQVMGVMGIRGWYLQVAIPLVEWREGMPMPDGSTRSDFIMTGQGIHPSFFSGGAQPELREVTDKIGILIWEKCFGAVVAGPENPTTLPDVPPNPAAN